MLAGRDPSPRRPVDAAAEVVRWLFPIYIFIILIGFFLLRADSVMPAGNHLTHDRAVFQAVNAATLTGFQLSIHPTEYFTPGKVILLCLIIAGTLFSLIVGGLAVKRILRLEWSDWRLVSAAIMLEIFVLIAGMFGGGGNTGLLEGAFQSAAAFANCGLYIGVPPSAASAYTHLFLIPLSVLGGLGLTVILEIGDTLTRRRPLALLSIHARRVLTMTAGLYLIGMAMGVLLQLLDMNALGLHKDESYFHALGRLWPLILSNASITSLNARSAGLNILPIYGLPRSMTFFTMLLMFIGASPAGTGGGLKTTTLHQLLSAPRRALRALPFLPSSDPLRPAGPPSPLARPFGIAATWLGLYLGALLLFQMLLLRAAPQVPGDRMLFITVSALSNVGLSHDILSMTGASLYLLAAAMFFGRITPLLILWWMADSTKDADVAVG